MNREQITRVLIVEDDFLVGEMIQSMLEKSGYTVVARADDGPEAIQMSQMLRPDLVLMDLELPGGMDGIQTAQRIQADCPTPVVMLTAYASPDLIRRASAAGVGAYLTKPSSLDELERAITISLARFADLMELRRLNAELQAEIAEHARTEATLKKSEALYHDLVETSQDLIWQCDAQGRYTYLNPAWEPVFGYTVKEMLGKRFSDFQRPEIAARDLAQFDQLMQGGSIKEYETVHIGKAGNEIHLVFNAKFVLDQDGAIAGTRGTAYDITGRKRAEEALRRHEELLEAQFENSPDLILIIDRDYKIITINRIVAGDFTVDGLRGADSIAVLPPEHQTQVRQTIDRCFELGAIQEIEHGIGDGKWVRARIVPLKKNGLVTRALIISTDMTERKKTEEALRQREQEFKMLVENAPDMIVRFDRQCRHIYCNPAIEKELGVPPQSLLGKTHRDLGQPPERADWSESIIRQVFETGREIVFDLAMQTPSGLQHYLSRGAPEFSADGSITSALFIHRNITDRKRAEETLQKSEYLLKRSQRVARLGHYDLDVISGVWTSSETLDEIFGIDRNYTTDVAGWVQVVHPEHRDMMATYFAQEVLGQRKPFDKEYQIMRVADGQTRWVHGLGELVFDPAGNPIHMFGTIQDITERKHAEEQIRASLAEKEILLKEVHHRVKNNLQVVYSLLNLQAGHIPDPRVRRAFRESQDRVRSMALVHEKLYQSSDLASIDFGDYVQKLVAHLYRSYQSQVASAAVQVDVADVFLGIDTAIPCGMLINELVSNSMKHAFPAGVPLDSAAEQERRVQVGLHRTEDRRLVLTVSDNGIGFPPEIDLNNADSLGLQLVTALVQQLGGGIELERGSGTTFTITFPEPG